MYWVVTAGLWIYVAALYCFLSRPLRQRLLPPTPAVETPWSGFEILSVLFLFFFWPVLVRDMADRLGFFTWLFGPDPPENLAERQIPWLTLFAAPLQFLTIPVLLGAVSGTRPGQLGLTLRGAGRHAVLGVLAWIVITPPTYVVLGLAGKAFHHLLNLTPEEHPLTKVVAEPLLPIEWLPVILTALVTAPWLEELLFRGLIQPWLMRRPWGGWPAILGAVLLAVVLRASGLQAAVKARDLAALLREALPLLFVLSLVPVYHFLDYRSRQRAAPDAAGPRPAPAIFGTALLFGTMHANVWPAPIPLFLLGLGLGWLAYRTQSLVAPIVVHTLFNVLPMLILLADRAVRRLAP